MATHTAIRATASSTAVTTTTTTVAVPNASSTPFNIYTRSTTPPAATAAILGVLAILLAIYGTYLLATGKDQVS